LNNARYYLQFEDFSYKIRPIKKPASKLAQSLAKIDHLSLLETMNALTGPPFAFFSLYNSAQKCQFYVSSPFAFFSPSIIVRSFVPFGYRFQKPLSAFH
jgi:hypothetical protein